MVLKYVRKVVKRLDTKTILTAAGPANVLERSASDVSFLAAMMVHKFCWHLPLYRQHQRLLDAGITLNRSSLTHWASRGIDLLAPITAAQAEHVLWSEVLAMDETFLEAKREGKDKMSKGWLWPVYGDADEVVFHYAPSREHCCGKRSQTSVARGPPQGSPSYGTTMIARVAGHLFAMYIT